MILVYEYMPNGSLADQLHKIRGRENYGVDIDAFPLTWERRLNICLGVARGLAYLHAGTRQCFVHRDVKPGNILLDEDWTPKVSDFGLSIDISDGNSVSHIAGTPGYLSPEYVCDGRVSDKADVYAFALVMLEVLSGRRLRVSDSMNLVDWALQCISEGRLDSIIDPSLGRQVSDDCLKCFVQVAVESLNRNPEERPTMSEVVWNLQLALKCQKQGTFTKVFSDITPSFDNIWRGCRNYGPSDDGYLQVLSRCSTKFQSPTLLLDRSFGIKSPGDVHLKPPSPNGTTQGVGQNSKAASDVHMKSLLSSTTQIVDKNMGSEYSLNDGIVIGQNCSSEVHKTSIGSLRSASILHLESISISSSGIMDKNFGSGSSRDVHLKPPFAESITSRQGRSSESASNVHMEPVSNNTVGTVHKDFGGGSSGDVHLQPPSTKSTTQMEGRSSRTKSDVHVKSQSKSTTHIVDKNIGSVLSMDTHREPPLAESTTDESANKNFESGSSRDGHCEPISDNTAKQYAFHSLTNGRGAIRYYFDDSVVIGQDCSSKVYRTCIDRPKKRYKIFLPLILLMFMLKYMSTSS
ncbi:Non-specific serine/threonine protein kinase [Bertholletia excelsa]